MRNKNADVYYDFNMVRCRCAWLYDWDEKRLITLTLKDLCILY